MKCWAREQAWPRTQLCSHVLPCSPIQVGRRSIINKLFFDLAQEEEGVLDAEFLKVPGISLFLLSPTLSASSFCSHPGRVLRAWGELWRGDRGQVKMSRWRNTLLSSPFGVSERFRPRVRVPLPRSPRLAKDLQPSSQPTLLLGQSGAEEKTSNPQPGRCEGPLFTTWLCLRPAGSSAHSGARVFPRQQ